MESFKKDAEKGMKDCFAAFERTLSQIRAGRASPALLDGLRIELYGSFMPVSQVANITNEDNRTLCINAWDKSAVPAIEKAILTSDLGLNPSTSGQTIRIVLPVLTEESRKGYIKQAKAEAENAKVAVRAVRKDVLHKIKSQKEEGALREDEVRLAETLVQKATDGFVEKIDEALRLKEKELLSF